MALTVLVGYSGAELSWRLFDDEPTFAALSPAPVEPTDSPVTIPGPGYAQLAALHLFGEAAAEAPKPSPVNAPKTRLQLTLRGIFLSDAPADRMAIIADSKGRERPYRIGDPIGDSAVVKEIHPQRVLLERNGRLEALDLPKERIVAAQQPQPAAPAALPAARSPARSPTRGFGRVDKALATNISTLGQHLRFEPVMVEGKLKGYRVNPKGDSQLLTQAGLAPGDLVTRVNGIPVNEPDAFAELARQLDEEKERFVLEVESETGPRRVNIRLD